MVTHFRIRANRPTQHLSLQVSSVLPLLKSYRDTFNDPNWQNGPLQAIVYSFATTYSLGPLSVNQRFLILVQRLSIVVLLMLLLRLVGCEISYVRVLHVHSRYQYANIFTKEFPSALFEELRTSPLALTVGEC
uniref:Ribonuclease H-like domain-containing protein n=1 Tax=Tanacetum cinerariifolium TaxID=118510 RepID=A0A6L2MJC2_TANCI|nr:ribonuclease H-like domain-containing protein [Tanacetum cinerariifolium]